MTISLNTPQLNEDVDYVSDEQRSTLFTGNAAAVHDVRQMIPDALYQLPSPEVALLRARLILEEALETIHALGVDVVLNTQRGTPLKLVYPLVKFSDSGRPIDLDGVIDGVCDLRYVATGTLSACGVPDVPHVREVLRANDSKFPNGEAVMDQQTGKYLKPKGWAPPDHEKVGDAVRSYATEHLLDTTGEIE